MSDTPPIIVSPNQPEKDQVAAGVRYVCMGLAAAATALGATHAAGAFSALAAYAGPAAIVIVFVWGQLKTRAAGKKLVTAAGAAPNSVAQVK